MDDAADDLRVWWDMGMGNRTGNIGLFIEEGGLGVVKVMLLEEVFKEGQGCHFCVQDVSVEVCGMNG